MKINSVIKNVIIMLLMLAGVCLVMTFLLPQMGTWVLLGVFTEDLMMLAIGIAAGILFMCRLKLNGRFILVGILAVGMTALSFYSFTLLAVDLSNGVKTIYLDDCHIESMVGFHGISNMYLEGHDSDGEQYSIIVPLKEVDVLQKLEHVELGFYENTSRLVEVY